MSSLREAIRHKLSAASTSVFGRTGGSIVIVYPQSGNVFYSSLAPRLAEALAGSFRHVSTRSALSVCEMGEGDLEGAKVVVIAPAQCYRGLPDKEKFVRLLSRAGKRIVALAEAVGTPWFANQFKVPLRFDALLDIGFASQEGKLADFDVPYYFLFNGPDSEERSRVEEATRIPASGRTILWATVGHDRGERVRLVDELLGVDPQGVVFLPPAGITIKEGNGMIGPDSLQRLLQKTKFYVWCSLHDFDYYESFRFREAILAGAVPCKIDPDRSWQEIGVPGVFASVRAFADSVSEVGFESMLNSSREFYLSGTPMSGRLQEILEEV